MQLKICFLGGSRYNQPLEETSEKKFQALKVLGKFFVIGFSQDLRPRSFTQYAHFFLMPQVPIPVIRYLLMFTLGLTLAIWVIFTKGVRVLVAQSPYEGFAAAIAKVVAEWFGRRVTLIVENHGDFEVSLLSRGLC